MASHFYWAYQTIGWLTCYLVILLSVKQSPFFTSVEYAFGAILVFSTALCSHIVRISFKRWLQRVPLGGQIAFLLISSLICASLAGSALFLSVLLFSAKGWVDPITPGQSMAVFHNVFWGNSTNMLGALLLWSAFYLTLVKARQLRKTRTELASSQLEVLLQQVNPHFLFNMINNIRALILEDPERARDSLARLADMLRYTLATNDSDQPVSQVTLVEEFSVVEEYIALCTIQYENRLQFSAHMDKSLELALIPKMVLQLCIENAIKHGVSLRTAPSQVSFMAIKKNTQMILTVENPIPLDSQPSNAYSNTKVGLKNIRRRLALLYRNTPHQDSASLQFHIDRDSSANEPKALTTLTLPIEYERQTV